MIDALLFAIGFLAGPTVFRVMAIRTRTLSPHTRPAAYGATAAAATPCPGSGFTPHRWLPTE
ncbi:MULTISPECIES: hypothetical protein [Roseovarius]|jgi:hypothetical protein|uniref:hypothetical protein n=1 Tax=Roseovarius TaxID=74030 RepID=UPI0011AF04BC|nr:MULTISPECIES: hypothetical protein [Roseovarius]